MICERIKLPDGTFAIVCSSRRRRPSCSAPGCNAPSEFQCDFPLKGRASGRTCSKHLCRAHRVQIDGPEMSVDLCLPHADLVHSGQASIQAVPKAVADADDGRPKSSPPPEQLELF
jgi:hypothetical protein